MALTILKDALGLPRKDQNRAYDALFDVCRKSRLPFDKDVWLNLAFFQDEQYVEWASEAMTVRQIPRDEGREKTPRPVANKIMHFVAQEHSMALQTRPTFDVLPAGDGPLDVSDSNVALALLRWHADDNVCDLDGVLSDATMWALVAGEAYLKWSYNQSLDRADICSVSPLDLYGDPYSRRFRDSRFVIHSQFMDPEQVYDIYGIEINKQNYTTQDPLKSAALRDMGSAPVTQGCTVNELWMKPNRRHKNGLFVVWCGNQRLIEPGPHPYDHKKIPFTQLGVLHRLGTPHYTSPVKFMRSQQMELNLFHAQRILIRQSFANPKWWIPNDIDLENDPDDSPNQVLRGDSGNGNLKPEIIQPTAMAMTRDEGDWIVNEMMHTIGLHEVSQAQVPGRVEAAKAIEMLKESDASRLAELLRTTKSSLAEGGWQILQLCKQFMSPKKMLVVYSPEGMPEVRQFQKSTIAEGMRVQVTMGTGLARSRAAREDQVWKMLEAHIIQDPEVAAELLDLPVGTVMPDKAYDIRIARNENWQMQGGTAITPHSWDDHEIHLREHNNYRKTQEFLTSENDVQQKFEYHCDTHETLQVSALQKQLAKQSMIQQAMQAGQGQPAPGGSQTAPAVQGGPDDGSDDDSGQ